MLRGRWETTRGQRHMVNNIAGATAARVDRPPLTTVSICSGGPLPTASPPIQKGCELKSYQKSSHTMHLSQRCRWRDGWRDEVWTMNFSPSRYEWQTQVTVQSGGMTSSFEDYGTSRWVGPCKPVP